MFVLPALRMRTPGQELRPAVSKRPSNSKDVPEGGVEEGEITSPYAAAKTPTDAPMKRRVLLIAEHAFVDVRHAPCYDAHAERCDSSAGLRRPSVKEGVLKRFGERSNLGRPYVAAGDA